MQITTNIVWLDFFWGLTEVKQRKNLSHSPEGVDAIEWRGGHDSSAIKYLTNHTKLR